MLDARDSRRTSARRIIYTCPFVPAEWIAAHGFRPSRVMPAGTSGAASPAGLCSYCQAFLSASAAAGDSAAVILTTACDQMRRAAELDKASQHAPVFLLNVPSSWQTTTARRMYASELARLGRFLCQAGGIAPGPADISRAVRELHAEREKVLALAPYQSAGSMASILADWQEHGEPAPALSGARERTSGIPLALLGGPMLRSDLALLEAIEELGGRLALEGTETGEAGLPAAPDLRELERDPLGEIVRMYFDSIPHVARRPNSLLFRWIDREIRRRAIRGLILRRYTWCDLWHAEIARLREWSGLPLLEIEVDAASGAGLNARARTRLEAFMDMLRDAPGGARS